MAVHPLAAKGRLPTNIPAIHGGAAIVDFELDPFDKCVVCLAGDDSKIRIFKLPSVGLGEEGLSEYTGVLSGILSDLTRLLCLIC